MRIGNNPNNHKKIDTFLKSHRVIIPVYIPNFEGYFKDSLNVFKVCLESLIKTINNDTAISIISNASCSDVNDYIYDLKRNNRIDRAIFNKENVGKMNAIISETRASFEEYITYSDADVFFDKNWLLKTYNIFKNVPEAGFVSMNPTPQNYTHSESTILSNLVSVFFKKFKTSEICSYDDLKHFHDSIGRNENFTKNMFKSNILSISNNNYIIGAGHFCCTIKKTPTLKYVPKKYSNIGVSGGSESVYLDIPFNKTGLWKLSSPKAHVWHMGNVLEEKWVNDKLKFLEKFKEDDFSFFDINTKRKFQFSSIIPYKLRIFLVRGLKKIKALD